MQVRMLSTMSALFPASAVLAVKARSDCLTGNDITGCVASGNPSDAA